MRFSRRVMITATVGAGVTSAQTIRSETGAAPEEPAFAEITDEPGLRRALLIGDSISIGYTLFVRELLKGKANVHRIPTNAGPTPKGIENIDEWLGKRPWDAIHFNWGLHDVKYMFDDQLQVDLPQYVRNLGRLVWRLHRTGARLIWATTTPVPSVVHGPKRISEDVVRYNAAALDLMRREGVAVNDLYTVANERLAELQRPENVHFTEAGSKVLAEHVASSILAALHSPAPANTGL
ncbi:MAG: SGNH/GDSL hydrolase family protein [Bryobacterales bacterium]|nr:SGNH/GDSL hydrolase family protein [Bryobacterales bacterium]